MPISSICLILNQMIGTLSIAEAQKFTVMIVIQQMYTAFSQTLSSSIQTVCQIFYIVHVAVIIAIHTSQDNFMLNVLKGNKPLQSYIAAAASDKIAQQVGSQAIINTLFSGIVIGNMGIATILGIISMVPSLFFAAFGAKYVGKHGSKKGIVTWTYVSMAFTALLILFLIFTDPKQIGVMGSWNMIVYVLLTILQSGSNFHGRDILPHQCQRTFILFQVVPSQIDSIFHSTISL